MKNKWTQKDLEVVEQAILWYTSGVSEYTCNCIKSNPNCYNVLRLYQDMMGIRPGQLTTFRLMCKMTFIDYVYASEISEIRMMALAMLYEIVRLKVNRKAAGF